MQVYRFPRRPAKVTILCPHCSSKRGADNEGKAVRAIARHIVKRHMPVEKAS
jgi:hypothetical protein